MSSVQSTSSLRRSFDAMSPLQPAPRFEDAEKLAISVDLLPVLSSVLSQLAARNDSLPFTPTLFHAPKPPGIAFDPYMARIKKYAGCSDACFVVALIYIDRMIQSHPDFVVNSLCIHRLFFICVVTAAKFFDDHYYDNLYYSKVGGITLRELNRLEIELLFQIDFTLSVPTSVFSTYRAELMKSLMPAPGAALATSPGSSTGTAALKTGALATQALPPPAVSHLSATASAALQQQQQQQQQPSSMVSPMYR